ncbi:hypothetical protein GQ600_25615 [Phytophthora cactorum]|nr:hypothetical protein GQ600_25615 [Phytophthora cactorum]
MVQGQGPRESRQQGAVRPGDVRAPAGGGPQDEADHRFGHRGAPQGERCACPRLDPRAGGERKHLEGAGPPLAAHLHSRCGRRGVSSC